MNLFVYGTLKQGYGNNRLLAGAEFLGPCTISSSFYLVDLGPFPAALPSNEQHEIVGEVYKIDSNILRNTDRLEGYPGFYNRSLIETDFGPAWIYHFDDDSHKNKGAIKEWHSSRRERTI